jgi:site-specific recombinase XerD
MGPVLEPTRSAAHALALVERPPLSRHPAAVYLGRLAASSRRTMRTALDTLAGLLSDGRCDALDLDWSRLRYQHTHVLRTILADTGYAPATANRHLAALRGVLKECWRLGLMTAEDHQRAADLAPIRGTRLPRGRALPAGELRALFAACAHGPDQDRGGRQAEKQTQRQLARAVRDAALLALLYGSGLRRAEAVALDLADYDQQAGTLRVRGKGNKERLAHLSDGAAAALDGWLAVRGAWAGPLFVSINKGGALQQRRLSGQGILHIGRQRQRAAGIGAFSPHDLRRTFIGDLLDAGADLSTVQQLAGHAQIQTTARYDRRGEATKKKAAKLLHVPVAPATRPR